MTSMDCVASSPSAFVMKSCTTYVPSTSHAFSTSVSPRAPDPSPKSHVHEDGSPELKSVKRTISPTVAVVADDAKFAINCSVSGTSVSSSVSGTCSIGAGASIATPTPSGGSMSASLWSFASASLLSSPPCPVDSADATSAESTGENTEAPVSPMIRRPSSSSASSPWPTVSSPSSSEPSAIATPATTESILTIGLICPASRTAADNPSGWLAHRAAPRMPRSNGTPRVPKRSRLDSEACSRSTTWICASVKSGT